MLDFNYFFLSFALFRISFVMKAAVEFRIYSKGRNGTAQYLGVEYDPGMGRGGGRRLMDPRDT